MCYKRIFCGFSCGFSCCCCPASARACGTADGLLRCRRAISAGQQYTIHTRGLIHRQTNRQPQTERMNPFTGIDMRRWPSTIPLPRDGLSFAGFFSSSFSLSPCFLHLPLSFVSSLFSVYSVSMCVRECTVTMYNKHVACGVVLSLLRDAAAAVSVFYFFS